MRRILRAIVVGAVTGAVVLSVGWATVGVVPVDVPAGDGALDRATLRAAGSASSGERLPGGLFRVGAAKVSIAPTPVAEGGPWVRHGKDGQCQGQATVYTPDATPGCLRTFDGFWATGVDEAANLGVYVRAMTISNGADTIALAVMDTIGWFAGYPESICGDCGAKAIGEALEAELGIPANNIVISSTHTHASVDTVAASPSWYFELVRDATKQAIRDAHASAQLASIETGTIAARAFNTDRRIVTRAVPDYELTWLRAVATEPEEPAKPALATMVNFSVHPTITAGNRDLHSGLSGHLAERLEGAWGGTAMFMPAGLGDQTVNRGFGRDGFGQGLGDLVIESQSTTGHTLRSNTIASTRRWLQLPADNGSLVAANLGGIFVRESSIPGQFAGGPVTTTQQRGGANTPSCVSAAPVSVITPVGGIRIGEPGALKQRAADGSWAIPPGDPGDAVVILQSPGEAFGSIAATAKDYLSRARTVMMIGLANDQIGYIVPQEQYDHRAANAAGLLQPSARITNYEESLSTGRCTGDAVLNALIESGADLGVMGDGERR